MNYEPVFEIYQIKLKTEKFLIAEIERYHFS